MYYLRIGTTNFPVVPDSITVESKNTNSTVTLANEGEINITHKPGLTDYSMDIRLPDAAYSWADWTQPAGSKLSNGFHVPDEYLDILRGLKESGESFLLILTDNAGNGFSENVTLETMSIERSTEWVTASCGFKKYVSYKTKVTKKKK